MNLMDVRQCFVKPLLGLASVFIVTMWQAVKTNKSETVFKGFF